MKLLFTAAFGLCCSPCERTGSAQDSMGSMFANRDEMALMRGEIADLPHGRGSAAPTG